MERAGLIAQLHESTGGVRGLGKVEKIEKAGGKVEVM